MPSLPGSVYAARRVVHRFLPPTPLFHAPALSLRLGCEVYVKCENLSPIRSFKARGAIFCLSRLDASVAGVACASTGNHGQGMAYAARLFGRRAVVIVPETTTEQKIAAMRYFGADLRVAGHDLAEAGELARRVAAEEDLVYVEDGEDQDVLIGCATLGLEVLEQLPDLDCLFVPVGGGNLIAACALVLKALRPDATLVGVQSTAAPAVYESWRAGHALQLDRCDTFAGGVATSYPCTLAFGLIQSSVDQMILVSDDDLIDAAITMLAETGQLPEGAGAAGLAALLADPERWRGRKVVVVLSGGNFEPAIWGRLRGGA
jgi:threonine dehydratase